MSMIRQLLCACARVALRKRKPVAHSLLRGRQLGSERHTKYNASYLQAYVCAVNAAQGVVTLDAQLFRDGSINQAQIDLISQAFS
jgi:hypothetical protein